MRSAPLPADPAENSCTSAACRAHACEATLRRLEGRLDVLARSLHSADSRLMARAMFEALREDGRNR